MESAIIAFMPVHSYGKMRYRSAGSGCLLVAGIVFFAFTAVMAVGIIQGKATTRIHKNGPTTSLSSVPGATATAWYYTGVFGGIGGLLIAIAVKSRQPEKTLAQRMTEFPDQPWKWNSDDPLVIRDEGGQASTALWFITIFWNLISGMTPFVIFKHYKDPTAGPGLWISLIFPLIGLALIGVSIYFTIQARKFPIRELHLSSVPVVPGTVFEACVLAANLSVASEPARMRLSCTRNFQNRKSSSATTLWEAEHVVPADRIESIAGGAKIPVYFEIPQQATPTTPTRRNAWVQWTLSVHMVLPGVDFAATFEVPVFRTTTEPGQAEHGTHDARPDYLLQRQPLNDRRISVETHPLGWKIITLPAARDKFGLVVSTLFGAAWTGGTVLVWLKQMMCFLVPMVLVDALVLYSLAILLGLRRRFVLRPRQVDVENRFFGFAWKKSYTDLDIATVEKVLIGESSQSTYYAIQLTRRDGGKTQICRDIRTVGDAEWFADQISEALWPVEHQQKRIR